MQSNLRIETMEVAREMALKSFSRDPDREAKVNDAVSTAWELADKAPPGVLPRQIARNAIKRIKVGRQFQQSVRSIDGPPLNERNKTLRHKPQRDAFDVAELASVGDNPAEIVQVRIDLDYIFQRLSPKQRAIVLDLARGETTQDVAAKYGLCDGRISQIRRLVRQRWNALDA